MPKLSPEPGANDAVQQSKPTKGEAENEEDAEDEERRVEAKGVLVREMHTVQGTLQAKAKAGAKEVRAKAKEAADAVARGGARVRRKEQHRKLRSQPDDEEVATAGMGLEWM